jgi:hypothetical protein
MILRKGCAGLNPFVYTETTLIRLPDVPDCVGNDQRNQGRFLINGTRANGRISFFPLRLMIWESPLESWPASTSRDPELPGAR